MEKLKSASLKIKKLKAELKACNEEIILLEYKENVLELYAEGKKPIEIYHGLLAVIDMDISFETFKSYYKNDFKEINDEKKAQKQEKENATTIEHEEIIVFKD